MFVYLITNTINGKRYVGQTTKTLEWRWKQHQKKRVGCSALLSAIKKYGAENFSVDVICEPLTIELMNEIEAEYIQRYYTLAPNGYNLMSGGAAPRHSVETRAKLSDAHSGKILTEEHRKKISLSLMGNSRSLGIYPSIETRDKIAETSRNRKHTPETIKKMKLIQSNRSEQWRNRISEAKKGKAPRVGFKHSEETIQKMKESWRIRSLNKIKCPTASSA